MKLLKKNAFKQVEKIREKLVPNNNNQQMLQRIKKEDLAG